MLKSTSTCMSKETGLKYRPVLKSGIYILSFNNKLLTIKSCTLNNTFTVHNIIDNNEVLLTILKAYYYKRKIQFIILNTYNLLEKK